jgi:two-component SAPR family response regulator
VPDSLQGLRVIVVEDEAMLSLNLQDMLADLGYEIAGTAGRLEKAIELGRNAQCDAAVLDLNLAGKRVDPVARLLIDRGIPFIFASGYGEDGLDGIRAPLLEKPYEIEGLRRALTELFAKAHERPKAHR